MAPLHGVQAFKSFIKSNKRPDRVPKLIGELEEWENEQILKSTNAANKKSVANIEKNRQKQLYKNNFLALSFFIFMNKKL